MNVVLCLTFFFLGWLVFFLSARSLERFIISSNSWCRFLFLKLNVFHGIVFTHVWIIVQNFFFRFESIVMHVHILYGFKIKHLFVIGSWIKTDVPDVSVTLFTCGHLFLSTICISMHLTDVSSTLIWLQKT